MTKEYSSTEKTRQAMEASFSEFELAGKVRKCSVIEVIEALLPLYCRLTAWPSGAQTAAASTWTRFSVTRLETVSHLSPADF